MSAYLHYTRVLHFTSASSVVLEYRTQTATEVHWASYSYHLHQKMQYPLCRATRYMSHLLQAATVSSAPRAIPRELAVVVCSYANIPQSYSIWLGVTDKPTQHSFSATTRPSSAYSSKLYNCLWPSTWDGWETLSHCGHRTSVNSLEPSMDSYVRSIYQVYQLFLSW